MEQNQQTLNKFLNSKTNKSKMKKSLTSFLLTLTIALIVGVTLGSLYSINPVHVAGGIVAVKIAAHFISQDTPEGSLTAGINKEIWIDKLKENFWADASDFLKGVDDWSEWVEYNTINFSVMGTDPVVLKNNGTWPIVAVQRTDTNSTVVLDTYDTTTTRVRNVEEIEAAIDKLTSVIKQHKKKLQLDIANEAIWNYGPSANATATPVIQTTGATRSITVAGGALSTVGARVQLADISALQERFDILDYPQDGRILVLHPAHRKDLMDADTTLFKQFSNLKTGEFLDLFNFKITTYSTTPTYTKTTYVKKAFGTAFDATNDVPASVAFINSEVMKCMGDVEIFYKEKGINPEQRADEVGFQMRAKLVTQRGQAAIGAIVTARA
jgi:hypothetical protein